MQLLKMLKKICRISFLLVKWVSMRIQYIVLTNHLKLIKLNNKLLIMLMPLQEMDYFKILELIRLNFHPSKFTLKQLDNPSMTMNKN